MIRTDKKIKPYCVVIGGINIDIQAFCDAEYRKRDSNPGYIKRSLGGVGRNIAENLVRLGLHTEMITILGDSSGWKRLISHIEHAGIGLNYSPRLPRVPLPSYLCILERDGALVGAVADMRAIEQMRIGHLEEQKALLDEAEAIIVDGNIPQACIEWLAGRYGTTKNSAPLIDVLDEKGNIQKPLLVADPVSSAKAKKFRDCFGRFDIAKPNIAELAIIAGTENTTLLSDIIASLDKTSNLPRELYVSIGERGMYVAKNNVSTTVFLPPQELRPHLRNYSGAGDAACATLVWLSMYENLAARKSWDYSKDFTIQNKAKVALVAALYTASSKYPVNPRLNESSLCESAKNCYPEISEFMDNIRRGGII